MDSKERVLKAIMHEMPDRVPMNIWATRLDVQAEMIKRYGSMDKMYKRFNIDIQTAVTPPPCRTNPDYLEELMSMNPEDLKDEHWYDPDDPIIYKSLLDLKKEYGDNNSIFAHVWGCVESIYGFFGIERTLLMMAGEPDHAIELFSKVADFSEKVVKNILKIGVDVLHITGDVGSNSNMLFSPVMWRTQVRDLDRRIIKPAKDKGIPVSLHSCGYCAPIIPDWIEMGVQVLHPIQESAGMDMFEIKRKFGNRLTLHGGLDIRALSVMKKDEVVDYVKPRMEFLKRDGGFIFNTAHQVQMDISLDILEYAYDIAMGYAVY